MISLKRIRRRHHTLHLSRLILARAHMQAIAIHGGFPVGAEVQADGSTHFPRVGRRMSSASAFVSNGERMTGREVVLEPEDGGIFSAHVPNLRLVALYRLSLDGAFVADPRVPLSAGRPVLVRQKSSIQAGSLDR
jgi:hypothetical protein